MPSPFSYLYTTVVINCTSQINKRGFWRRVKINVMLHNFVKTPLSLLLSRLHLAKNKHRLEARAKFIFRNVLFRCSRRNIWDCYCAPPLCQVIHLQKLREGQSSPGFQPKWFMTLSCTLKSSVSFPCTQALSEEEKVAWSLIWGVKLLVFPLDFHVYTYLLGRSGGVRKREPDISQQWPLTVQEARGTS